MHGQISVQRMCEVYLKTYHRVLNILMLQRQAKIRPSTSISASYSAVRSGTLLWLNTVPISVDFFPKVFLEGTPQIKQIK